MDDTTILVTGASGFVGSHIAIDLARAGHKVVALGGSSACGLEVEEACHATRQIDLSDQNQVELLLEEVKPGVVVHSAALARADICEKDPDLAERSNVLATQNLVNAAKNSLFLHISTDLVFDGGVAPEGGFLETDDACPKTVYGISKAKSEQIVLSDSNNSLVLRTCLVYGAQVGERAGFLSWLKGGLEQGKEINLFVDEWRTPIFTGDISIAIEKVFSKHLAGASIENRVLHLAGAERISRYDFGLRFAEVFGYDASVIKPSKQADVQSTVHRSPDVSLSANLLKECYDFQPSAVAEGLSSMKSKD